MAYIIDKDGAVIEGVVLTADEGKILLEITQEMESGSGTYVAPRHCKKFALLLISKYTLGYRKDEEADTPETGQVPLPTSLYSVNHKDNDPTNNNINNPVIAKDDGMPF